MTVRRLLLPALLCAACAAVPPGPAAAAVGPPVQLAAGDAGTSVAAATDAEGTTVAVLRASGTLLAERPAGAAGWGAPVALPGATLGRPAGPVVAAAGRGVAGIAWRVDTPRRYNAIAAMVRDPGEVFAAPVVVSPADANGVRHPALAVDGEGRALLAYTTNTRAVHLSLKGAIAISLRGAHRSFAAPEVVDPQPSSAPAVALGADGRGVVAWLRARRVWAVSVDVESGTVGRARALTGPGGYDALRVAAGPAGAATVAFVVRHRDGSGSDVAVLRRRAGGTFPRRVQVVSRVARRAFLGALALAADDDGQATLAWSPETFGSGAGNGVNGVTSSVRAAVAEPGAARFGPVRTVVARGRLLCDPPALAAANGRAVVAFTCRNRSVWRLRAATVDAEGAARAQLLTSTALDPAFYAAAMPIAAGIDDGGTWTVLAVHTDAPVPGRPPAPTTARVVAISGR
jgi:hypothetical protein